MAVSETLDRPSWLSGPHRRPSPHLEEVTPRNSDLTCSIALTVILLGAAWRLIRYALAFPIWGDEAMFALNLVSRDLTTTLDPLEFGQVAPALFVLGEWFCYHLLGSSEYSLRLLPLLAGLASLPLFWMLARTLLPRRTALLAVAILSVSHWPVSMSTLIKPYSSDLFWTLTLLLPACKILRQPTHLRWWAFLIGVTPLALLGSFPAVFVSAGVGTCAAVAAWRARSLRVWLLVAGLGLVTLAAFAVNYLFFIEQTRAETQDYMQWYWRDGFPPSQPLAFLLYLAKAHVGQMFAYPLGVANGGSSLTFLFVLLGAIHLYRGGHRSLLLLCLSPFAFSLIGAFLKKYPYGDACRLAQHLAPAICLLAAIGLNSLLSAPNERTASRRSILCLLLLAAVGLAGLGRDVARPYRGIGDQWTRRVVTEIFCHIDPNDQVFVHNQTDTLSASCRWYLIHQRTPVQFLSVGDTPPSDSNGQRIWCLHLGFSFQSDWRPQADCPMIACLKQNIESNKQHRYHFVQKYVHVEKNGKRDLIQYCGVHLWSRADSTPLLASWGP